jgi:hypothetical protein
MEEMDFSEEMRGRVRAGSFIRLQMPKIGNCRVRREEVSLQKDSPHPTGFPFALFLPKIGGIGHIRSVKSVHMFH